MVATITGVTSTNANATYGTGSVIAITVTFSENVTVSGVPQLTLETGTIDRVATYTGGSGGSILTFNYTVQPGDSSADLDYQSVSALTGTITNTTGGGNATLTLAAPGAANSLGAAKAIVIATTPTITSVTSTAANGTYGVGSVIPITVTFDQAVAVTGAPTLTLETGAIDRAATYLSGSGTSTLTFNYVVQAGDVSADLDYLAVSALTGTITNATSTANATLTLPTLAGASSLAGQKAIVIDTVAPTVSSVTVPANGTYDDAGLLNFTVNYTEAVTVTTSGGTPRIAITLDTGIVYANYLSGSGTTALVFRLPVTAAMTDATGIAVASALELNGGTIKDAGGNDAGLTLTGLPATTGILIANSSPVLSGDLTAIVTEDGSYVLTTADLAVTDPDDSGTGLTFTVSGMNDGSILMGGKAVTSFTAADVAAGLVSFDHDGSEDPTASFLVSVEDGNEDKSTPTTSTFNLTVTGTVDIIDGTSKDDDLRGTIGADTISGFKGDDRLVGLAGDDMLIGGRGNDRLTGGDGVDTFVFSGKFGIDTIVDFDAKGTDHDIIDLAGVAGASDFADLKKNHLSERGDDVVITFGKNEIILHDVNIKDLDADDFLF